MARLTIEHNNDDIITLSQAGQHVVMSAEQVDSVIKNLEIAALEMRHANFERHRRDEIRRLQEWDSERRSFDAVYVGHVDTSQVVD